MTKTEHVYKWGDKEFPVFRKEYKIGNYSGIGYYIIFKDIGCRTRGCSQYAQPDTINKSGDTHCGDCGNLLTEWDHHQDVTYLYDSDYKKIIHPDGCVSYSKDN